MNEKYKKKKSILNGFFYNLSITNWIILIDVLAFIIFSFILSINSSLIDYIALRPSNFLQGKNIWTLLTSMFMHAGIIHLLVNMVSLAFIGNFIEKIIGRKRFLWFYLISGLIAGLFFIFLTLLFQNELNIYAVGASGAIFGLGGLLMILTPKLPVLVFFIIPMPMWIAMIFMLGVLWVASLGLGLPIGNTDHLGGLIAGIIYGLYLRNKYKRKVAMLNKYFR